MGSYTGEVLIRAYGGHWIQPDGDAPAIMVSGVTGFPFTIAHRILIGEPFKSLASFGRALPVIAEVTWTFIHCGSGDPLVLSMRKCSPKSEPKS